MTGKEVGSIIGKGGEIINSIREESGAKIHISDGAVPERIVTVTGQTESIFKSFNLISKKLDDEGTTGSHKSDSESSSSKTGSVTLRLIVPASQCGSLIGKGGSKIKEIREITGASVVVASEMLPNSTERTVIVSGSKSAISQCIYQICCVMLESPPKGATIPYAPKSGGGGILGLGMGGGNSRGGRGGGGHQDNPLASLLGLGSGASTLAAIATLAGSQLRDRRHGSDREESRGSSGGGSNTQTHEMSIPNDMIGCIIGKGGSNIAEIRQLSGAMIRISKSDES
jgi:poly(rC)-binding protein 2/3/4